MKITSGPEYLATLQLSQAVENVRLEMRQSVYLPKALKEDYALTIDLIQNELLEELAEFWDKKIKQKI
jgi:hypothetical protein